MELIIDTRDKLKNLQHQVEGKFVRYGELASYEEQNIFNIITWLTSSPTDEPQLPKPEAPKAKVAVYWYTTDGIFDEVYKRTSFIGKTRALDKEGAQNALDVFAFTEDEKSLFKPFLRTIAAQVFDSLSAFTRNVKGAYAVEERSGIAEFDSAKTYNKGDLITSAGSVLRCIAEQSSSEYDPDEWEVAEDYLFTDDKIVFYAAVPKWFNENASQSVDNNIFEAIVNYIIGKYFSLVNISEKDAFYADAAVHLQEIIIQANKSDRVLHRSYNWF